MLENRFESFRQTARLLSGDRGGNRQTSAFQMRFRDFTRSGGEPGKDGETGVLSKSIVRYTEPFDVRHSGYLLIHNRGRADDQFVYRSSQRLVRRVNLKGEAVFGSDFSFEDVIPRELEDARYERREDERVLGVDCYHIVATPTEESDSEYSRFEIDVDRERMVPIRTLYWDARGVAIKQLVAPPEHYEQIHGVWVPRRSIMTNLRLGSFSELHVVEIEPDVELSPRDFDLRQLSASH